MSSRPVVNTYQRNQNQINIQNNQPKKRGYYF